MKARKTFRETLQDNDKAQRAWAVAYGKPVRESALNNVAEAKVRGPRKVSDIPTEHMEQKALVQWWGHQGPAWGYPRKALYAVPNGQALVQYATNPAAYMMYLRAEGFRDGVVDLCLDIPSGEWHGFRCEMKRTIGGVLSPEQSEYQGMFLSLGYFACVCKGADEAIEKIKQYLHKGEPA